VSFTSVQVSARALQAALVLAAVAVAAGGILALRCKT
jgi:hypothetical protein